jgi:quinol monooxygenase YgiN
MVKVALFVRLQAKPGKEEEVKGFLESAVALANRETTTPVWFALRMGPATFAIFDAFAGDAARQAHLAGDIARTLMAEAPRLLAETPKIEMVDVLAAKLPAGLSGADGGLRGRPFSQTPALTATHDSARSWFGRDT